MGVGSLRLRAASAALTFLSGALMMLAGYLGYTESWAAGLLITLPGGIVILAAFAAAVRADQIARDATADGPVLPGGGAVVAAILLSGAVMFFAGFAVAAWGWTAALALATLGGLIISAAFALRLR
jgi:hypothetical protein